MAVRDSVKNPKSIPSLHRPPDRPVVIYNSGGLGDHLMSLPALRALAYLWPHRLTVVCVPGASSLFFTNIDILQAEETTTFYTHCGKPGGILLNPMPVHGPAEGRSGAPFPDAEWLTWKPWTFDSDALARKLGSCDALLSLTPWHSPAIDRVREILDPEFSIAFSSGFMIHLPENSSRHIADLFFDVPRALAPSLDINDYAAGPIVAQKYRDDAAAIRKLIPKTMKVLLAHCDTKPDKEWDPRRFAAVVDRFLSQHRDHVCFIVGNRSFRSAVEKNQDRVFHCFPIHIATAFALVEHADLFLGIDSCMLHCADLHKVPGVGLFGPTNAATLGFRFARHKHACGDGKMESISTGEVLDALNEVADCLGGRG
jgi:ADP-heptose:LPS heptosyltransferase